MTWRVMAGRPYDAVFRFNSEWRRMHHVMKDGKLKARLALGVLMRLYSCISVSTLSLIVVGNT